jgi:hypothetical protein
MRNLLSNYPIFSKKITKNQELKPKKLNALNFHKIMLKNFKKMKEFQRFTKKLAEIF